MIRHRIIDRHRAALVAVTAIATLGLVGHAAADTLTIGLAAEATSMDPHFHNLTPNNQIAQHIFDNLINQDEAQRLVPALATE